MLSVFVRAPPAMKDWRFSRQFAANGTHGAKRTNYRPRGPPAAFLGFVSAFVERVKQATTHGFKPPKTIMLSVFVRAPPAMKDWRFSRQIDGETINAKAYAWWTGLPENIRHDLEERYRVMRFQEDDYFRSDRQLIEFCHNHHGPPHPLFPLPAAPA